jgi:hypothetical protein
MTLEQFHAIERWVRAISSSYHERGETYERRQRNYTQARSEAKRLLVTKKTNEDITP